MKRLKRRMSWRHIGRSLCLVIDGYIVEASDVYGNTWFEGGVK